MCGVVAHWEVQTLRELCTRLRLLRPVKGMLTVTKLGQRSAGDPLALWCPTGGVPRSVRLLRSRSRGRR